MYWRKSTLSWVCLSKVFCACLAHLCSKIYSLWLWDYSFSTSLKYKVSCGLKSFKKYFACVCVCCACLHVYGCTSTMHVCSHMWEARGWCRVLSSTSHTRTGSRTWTQSSRTQPAVAPPSHQRHHHSSLPTSWTLFKPTKSTQWYSLCTGGESSLKQE